ncbi:MAG: hypothetical protein ACERLM_06375 [Acidimicrobiales bacterium]
MSELELPSLPPDPADEGRHPPETDPLWNESWYFDFVTRDGSTAGYVRVGLYPNLDVLWYWAYLVRPDADRPLVAVIDHEVPVPPPAGSLELRTEGLWADHIVETPLDHVTVGLEAFGVALDRPEAAYGNLWGERIALGFDLEWETDRGLSFAYPFTTRYEISCTVHGEVLVGDERLDIDAIGQRDHSWGVRDWWAFGWCWISGWLEDGARFHAAIQHPEAMWAIGYLAPPDGPLEATVACRVDDAPLGEHGFPTSVTVTVDEVTLAVTPIGWAPVLLTSDDAKTSYFPRGAIRVRADDGRQGVGWIEFNQPSAKEFSR